jgi:hypothetical protein
VDTSPNSDARIRLAGPADAAGLTGQLRRLLHYDKAAAVRLQAPAGRPALAVFGRPPFEVLAMRIVRLAEPAGAEPAAAGGGLDATVSAGELLEALDEESSFVLPQPVAGTSWAGLMPPREGWEQRAELPAAELREQVAAGVREFRARAEALPEDQRVRTALDAMAAEIWDAPLSVPGAALGSGAPAGQEVLPLRLAHAAHSMGYLPEHGTVTVLRRAAWWRLRTPHGEIAHRRRSGLDLQPV